MSTGRTGCETHVWLQYPILGIAAASFGFLMAPLADGGCISIIHVRPPDDLMFAIGVFIDCFTRVTNLERISEGDPKNSNISLAK